MLTATLLAAAAPTGAALAAIALVLLLAANLTKAEEAAGKLTEAGAIETLAKDESRELTADESGQIVALVEEAETLQAAHAADQTAESEAAAARAGAVERLTAARAAQTASAGRLVVPAQPKGSGPTPAAHEDPKRGFGHFGEFAQAVYQADPQAAGAGYAVDPRLQFDAAATGLQQASGPDGGYLVPPSFITTIWDGLHKDPDQLLPATDQYTVEGESLSIPANAETSRATGSRYGGIRSYWISEAQQLTGSKPKFRQMKLEPHQLAVLVYITDKLLKNSPVALEQYLTRAATEEILFMSNDAIWEGNGVGKPLGMISSASRVTVAKEGGQGAATIVKENIDKMYARMHTISLKRANWYINQDCVPQLLSLKQDVGTGGLPVYLPPGGTLANAPHGTLYGRPVIPIEYANTVGTEGDISFIDPTSYASGLRGGIEAAMSIHLRFDFLEQAFRFVYELDGQPWLEAPLTPFKGTNTVSPIVTLATRA